MAEFKNGDLEPFDIITGYGYTEIIQGKNNIRIHPDAYLDFRERIRDKFAPEVPSYPIFSFEKAQKLFLEHAEWYREASYEGSKWHRKKNGKFYRIDGIRIIKLMREHFGLGLKDAKEIAERLVAEIKVKDIKVRRDE
jgi:hypothetical protein